MSEVRALKENSPEGIQDCKNWLPTQEQVDAIWGPELAFENMSEGEERLMNQVMENHAWALSSIYCPDLPEGSITNRSEDSLGGIAKIVTNDRNCPCKCYGWQDMEKRIREKLKDLYTSPEAMEEIRNWGIEEKDNRTIIEDKCFESKGLNNCLPDKPIKTVKLGENTFVSINGTQATNVESFNAKLKERVMNYEPTHMVD